MKLRIILYLIFLFIFTLSATSQEYQIRQKMNAFTSQVSMDRLRADIEKPLKKDIVTIVKVLERGGIVAMPTDSVYGLICDAENVDSIRKVYQLKQRPNDKPFLILVSNQADLFKYIQSCDEKVQRLMKKFLPGPLTMVFKRKKGINAS